MAVDGFRCRLAEIDQGDQAFRYKGVGAAAPFFNDQNPIRKED